MPEIKVYLSNELRELTLDPGQTLAQVRQILGVPFSKYQFIYWNMMTEEKMLLTSESKESGLRLGKFILQGPDGSPQLQLARVTTGDPDFFGNKVDSFQDRNLNVRVEWNSADGGPKGPDDFGPLMLADVKPANPDSDFFADKLVICQKGKPIQFGISSWGAAGYGFSIGTNRDTIVSGLYYLYGPSQYGQVGYTVMRSYEGPAGSNPPQILVESLKDKGINPALKADYSKITIKTWRVTSWNKGSESGSSALTAPSPRLLLDDADQADPFAEDPSGDHSIPGKSVEVAAPSAGKPSSQKIGEPASIENDGPDHVIGSVTFYLYVYRTKEDANLIFNILNSPQATPF